MCVLVFIGTNAMGTVSRRDPKIGCFWPSAPESKYTSNFKEKNIMFFYVPMPSDLGPSWGPFHVKLSRKVGSTKLYTLNKITPSFKKY